MFPLSKDTELKNKTSFRFLGVSFCKNTFHHSCMSKITTRIKIDF